jgi:hypothetical protein
MTKVTLQPLYFYPGRDEEFDVQLHNLSQLFSEQVDFLPPLPLGDALPEADAVIFPQILGEAYRRLDEFKSINKPILVVTSEFGTVSMWDWEICSYLRSEGVTPITAYSLEQTLKVLEALKVKQELMETKFLVFQDNPGEGFQASIFKRFYWWEEECIQKIYQKFGVEIQKQSFRELCLKAKKIPDELAKSTVSTGVPMEGITSQALTSASKLYLAILDELEKDPKIKASGINCLNESHFSDSTPCLAWNLLFEGRKLIWGCEADILSMLTLYLVYHTLHLPAMMTNLYPFLMGQAALKHEKIPEFPPLSPFQDHILAAHCGYLGVVPQSFSTTWKLRPKVLSIVDENATAIDAQLPLGAVTLVKLGPSLEQLSVVQGELVEYVQYPGSHCLNGGVIRIADGPALMRNLESHHYILVSGDCRVDLDLVAPIFSLEIKSC